MICPYCKKEMRFGYIQSSRMLVWDKEKLSGVILPSNGGIKLTPRFSKTYAIKAHFCETCNILLSTLNE
ncbi:PF20097 family protein [Evtepia sp.]|uniref:PF20097 family protein n=1 Tax=Evtepia sp. TaxID=2773933 RepID=UPI00387E941E